jgi:hypothetical protein
MSRANPTDSTPNPSKRWYEWDGSNGEVRHFDKTAKNLKDKTKTGANITSKLPFVFIVLHETATIKGWHDASDSGIFSNEVNDTRTEVLVVKSFKGGILAEGLYSQIRDRVGNHGGHFTSNLYIAFKDEAGQLQIGSLQLKGAALNAWVDFKKANRNDIDTKAVKITGYKEGKKGKIIFRTPIFAIVDIAEKTNTEAGALAQVLWAYLKGYFSRTSSDKLAKPATQPEPPQGDDEPPVSEPEPEPEAQPDEPPTDDTEIPF